MENNVVFLPWKVFNPDNFSVDYEGRNICASLLCYRTPTIENRNKPWISYLYIMRQSKSDMECRVTWNYVYSPFKVKDIRLEIKRFIAWNNTQIVLNIFFCISSKIVTKRIHKGFFRKSFFSDGFHTCLDLISRLTITIFDQTYF